MSHAELPSAPGAPHRRISNLREGLLRGLTADHGGVGTILAHRVYRRQDAPAGIAFIDLVVLPPHTSIGPHRHADNQETYVILSGQGQMTLDGEAFEVRAGDVIPNRPYGEHGLANTSDSDVELLVFEIGPLDGAR
ncbi:cupin domain-containing protein [Kitasatospora sp. GP82]|uniref:cupin domain-containing protein n=1 Tax=Kitasatospora sp. GP82 TaxID=3035089 RepID=UPI0024758C5E|nr:cupin domain-containing protein [Kitasatospora sp. GP82]MDH6128371.1 mannose-6-phosphate isomerase-like protein (cupin superfamily) [Kitasatospora sp. GP82]